MADDHFFLRATVQEMVTIAVDVAAHAKDGAFTAAQFRDRLDNGRKVAIQILDFFDRHGVTLNREDLRRVNKHRLDLFSHSSDGNTGRKSSWWGARTSNPSEAASLSLVGSNSRSLPPIPQMAFWNATLDRSP